MMLSNSSWSYSVEDLISTHLVQVCVDLALAIQMASVAESMAFGASLGLEAKTLADILNASSSRCWSSSNYNPVPVNLFKGLAVNGRLSPKSMHVSKMYHSIPLYLCFTESDTVQAFGMTH